MHGVKLLKLASMVGLTQSAIARHLGVNRVKVHYWANGIRPIPQRYLAPLMDCVWYATGVYLAAHKEVPGSIAEAAGVRQLIKDLLGECYIENLELRREGPSAAIAPLVAALSPYTTMPDAALRKPAQAAELLRVATLLKDAAELLVKYGPLMDLVQAEEGALARVPESPSVA